MKSADNVSAELISSTSAGLSPRTSGEVAIAAVNGTAMPAVGRGAVARLRGKPPLLTRMAVDVLCRRTSFSSAKLRRATGWAPVTSLPDGQAACVRWLTEQGIV